MTEETCNATCRTAPIPTDVIAGIQAESETLIQQGDISRATQRLAQLNGWLQVNGQFSTYGVDVAAFVAQVAVTPSPTLAPRSAQAATPPTPP